MMSNYCKFFILSIFSIWMIACAKNDLDVPVLLEQYMLKVGEQVEMSQEIRVVLYNVEDSRCPTSVTCVWEGEAKAYFQAIANQVVDTLILTSHGDCDQGNINCADTALFMNYRIILQSILPYPEKADPIPMSDYQVLFKIEEK